MGKIAIRTYSRHESAVFLKTNEVYGGLSNMAPGYPIFVNGLRVLTSEALYQACRFPHLPKVQELIISQSSPMTAKMRSKPYREQSRSDWLRVRVKIMRWCLRAKLVQNFDRFSALLLNTKGLDIVEESRRDSFWGANPHEVNSLHGANVLGRLLMELREDIEMGRVTKCDVLLPVDIDDFLILGNPIGLIEPRQSETLIDQDRLL